MLIRYPQKSERKILAKKKIQKGKKIKIEITKEETEVETQIEAQPTCIDGRLS